MKGIVKFINSNNGLCAIELESNNFTIFEDFDEGFEVGDQVSGNLEDLGGETLFNVTQGISVDGFIENIGCSEGQLRQQLKF